MVILNAGKSRAFPWLQAEESLDGSDDSCVSLDDCDDTDGSPILEQAPIIGWSGESWAVSGVVEVVAWEGAVSLPDVGNEHRDSPMLEQAPTAFWSEEPWAISQGFSYLPV